MLLLTTASGCLAGFPPAPAPVPAAAFDPVAFFTGRTHGEGTLDVRVGTDRSLRVEGTGRPLAGGGLELEQVITWSDSAVETRRWVIHPTTAGHYTATLSDAAGDVTAEASGNLFHLRYLLRQPHVYMEQWLYLQPDGRTVRNDAQVSVLGVPWARLAETITRGYP